MKKIISQPMLFGGVFFILAGWSMGAGSSTITDGYVVKVNEKTVFVDWGKNSGVERGREFSIYRKSEVLKHPVTGEVLGDATQTLADGIIDRVEDRFSSAIMTSVTGEVVPGDRTRIKEVQPVVPASNMDKEPAKEPTLQKVFQSDPYPDEAKAITVADLDGDGRAELIVAFPKQIEVFGFESDKLVSKYQYQERSVRSWMKVSVGDLKASGKPELFATTFDASSGQPWTYAIALENNKLKRQARFAGFVESIQFGAAQKLVWQDRLRFRELRYTPIYELTWSSDRYKPGAQIKTPLSDQQLMGFIRADLNGDDNADFAWLEDTEKLRIDFNDSKWKDRLVWGGTRNSFTFDKDGIGYWTPKLISWEPTAEVSKRQLIVSHNIPQLGVRLTYLKLYKQAELVGLAWNGLEMAPRWRIESAGYLADHAIGAVIPQKGSQLWTAMIGAGDKTVLSAYALP